METMLVWLASLSMPIQILVIILSVLIFVYFARFILAFIVFFFVFTALLIFGAKITVKDNEKKD